MLLENKVAVIYGAGDSIGGSVARAFARQGALVFLNGPTRKKLDIVAADICAHGGAANMAVVDAFDEPAVDKFVDNVVKQTEYIDISFNCNSYGEVQKPLTEISVEEFVHPIATAIQTQLLSTRGRPAT